MSWTDKIGGLLKQYASTGAAAQPAPDVHAQFEQVSQGAPESEIAQGLAAAFRSEQTPAFGAMLSSLFARSSGDPKAGLLNHLLGSMNPSTMGELLSGTGLAGLLAGEKQQLTAEQAQNVSPEVVQRLATHAEKTNPSIIDSVSGFYAQHSTLLKTLGGTAISIALAKIAERNRPK